MAKLSIRTPCTTFTLEDILCCVFGLKHFDVSVYFLLLNRKNLKVNEIADILNRDRSTVQRSVQNLISAGLVKRRQVNLKDGGYCYIYEAVPFDDIKKSIKTSLKKWCDEVIYWIDNIDEEKITESIN